MDETKAARRHKLLMREKERLAKAGQVDPDIDEELRKLIEQFPLLANRPLRPLQASTEAMLALGEAVHTEDKAAATAASSTDHGLSPTMERCSVEPQAVGCGSVVQQTAQPSVTDSSSSSGLSVWLGAAALLLRLWNDVAVAKPKMSAANLAKCIAVSILAAVLHFFVVDRCGIGMAVDPFIYWAAVNGAVMMRIKATHSFERVAVYCVRDGLGSFFSVLAAYTMTDSVLSMFLTRIPDTC